MFDWPIVSVTIFLPLLGSLIILFIKDEETSSSNVKWAALFTSSGTFILSCLIWFLFDPSIGTYQLSEKHKWFDDFNFNYHVGVDGISLFMILLSTFLTPFCILASWRSITKKIKEYMIAFLLLETFLVGMFSSIDMLLFYVFFEAVLIPMFLIIGIWGGERRIYASFKFFLYTLLGSVLMLIAIIVMYQITGSMNVAELQGNFFPKNVQIYLWLAFFASFAVKIPMWPFHTWLPDAHVEAPTAGSVILAGVLLKMGAYGFIRFSIGMFPEASEFFLPLIFSLSVIAIIYTSLVAFAQTDMKKLIAYSSVAHMGIVTIGIFVLNQQGMEGAMMQIISHGIVSAALFLCVGIIYDRMHTRKINFYGGLVNRMPKYAVVFMIFMLASIGLPGTSGFIGEFLILVGTFKKSFLVATIASLGVILAAAYMLWLYKRIIFGEIFKNELKKMTDLNKSEIFILSSLVFPIIFFGFYPEPLLSTIEISIENLIEVYNDSLNSNLVKN